MKKLLRPPNSKVWQLNDLNPRILQIKNNMPTSKKPLFWLIAIIVLLCFKPYWHSFHLALHQLGLVPEIIIAFLINILTNNLPNSE